MENNTAVMIQNSNKDIEQELAWKLEDLNIR